MKSAFIHPRASNRSMDSCETQQEFNQFLLFQKPKKEDSPKRHLYNPNLIFNRILKTKNAKLSAVVGKTGPTNFIARKMPTRINLDPSHIKSKSIANVRSITKDAPLTRQNIILNS